MLEKLVKGKVKKTKNGRFLLIERSFDEIDSGNIGKYIARHKKTLSFRNVRKRFPQIANQKKFGFVGQKNDALVFDVECCGLGYSDPLFLIGMANLKERVYRGLFARDYSEEKAVIGYFFRLLQEYKAFFSYNGSSYDLTRLRNRAGARGLIFNSDPRKSLKQTLGEAHVDLIRKGKRKLSNFRLHTIEEEVFKFFRGDDISSEEIPDIYIWVILMVKWMKRGY